MTRLSTRAIKLALIALLVGALVLLFIVLVSSGDEVTDIATSASTNAVLSPDTPWLGDWELVRGEVDDGKVFYAGPTAERENAPTLNLAADLSITGVAVCNSFFGRYDDGAVNTLSWTKKGCPISSVSEADFFAALSKVSGLALSDDWMRWTGGGATLEFVRPGSDRLANPFTDGSNDQGYKDDAGG